MSLGCVFVKPASPTLMAADLPFTRPAILRRVNTRRAGLSFDGPRMMANQ